MSKEPWKSEIAELAKAVDERFQSVEGRIGELSSNQQPNPSNPEGGEGKVPLFKCKGKECGFSTESVEDYVEHRIHEVLKEGKPAEEPKRTHQSAEEFLNCPECFPKFEQAFLKRGYGKAPEKKPEEAAKPKKKGFFH